MIVMSPRLRQRRPSFRGLLDDYPGAAAAYSLRPLSAAWRTQPVVRVRRSNDDAEADFTAAEVADGTLAGWTGANDGFVVTWYDQSGNTRNATQATPANQPRIVAGGVVDVGTSGKPMLVFNTDALQTNALDSIPSNANGFTMLMVGERTGVDEIPLVGQYNSAENKRVFSSNSRARSGSSTDQYHFGVHLPAQFLATRNAVVSTPNITHLCTMTWAGEGQNNKAQINNESVVTSATATPEVEGVSQAITIGIISAATYRDGSIAEVIIYPKILTNLQDAKNNIYAGQSITP
jgi:hypothetical protein